LVIFRAINRGEVSEEHDLIAKFCQHLHANQGSNHLNADQDAGGASSDCEDRLNDTPIHRQDLVQVSFTRTS
jgi:hypothetical protein